MSGSSRVVLIVAVAAASLRLPAAMADGTLEREQLQHSLDTACKVFTGDDDQRWAQADRCRREWFRTHEEAIWRLKLNPHARPVQAPSS